jgi:transcriptional regulator with XRE-family HTH domain
MKNIFADSIDYERRVQDLSIGELADKSGIQLSYLSKLLKGDRRWNDENIIKVCKALNLEIEFRPRKKSKPVAVR